MDRLIAYLIVQFTVFVCDLMVLTGIPPFPEELEIMIWDTLFQITSIYNLPTDLGFY